MVLRQALDDWVAAGGGAEEEEEEEEGGEKAEAFREVSKAARNLALVAQVTKSQEGDEEVADILIASFYQNTLLLNQVLSLNNRVTELHATFSAVQTTVEGIRTEMKEIRTIMESEGVRSSGRKGGRNTRNSQGKEKGKGKEILTQDKQMDFGKDREASSSPLSSAPSDK